MLGLVSSFGWFGTEATPLGMVFAVLLAFPWTRLIGDISSLGAGGGLLLLALALAANMALLLAAARVAARLR